MIRALEKLTRQPGIDLAMLVTPDGVPIVVAGKQGADDEVESDDDASREVTCLGRDDALAALAVGWSNELKLATAPLSWEQPARIVMRCARGSLVMSRTRGAILLVVLERGVAPEDVRLPMEGTVARIERSLRSDKKHSDSREAEQGIGNEPPGPIPSEKKVGDGAGLAETSSNNNRREGLSGT